MTQRNDDGDDFHALNGRKRLPLSARTHPSFLHIPPPRPTCVHTHSCTHTHTHTHTHTYTQVGHQDDHPSTMPSPSVSSSTVSMMDDDSDAFSTEWDMSSGEEEEEVCGCVLGGGGGGHVQWGGGRRGVCVCWGGTCLVGRRKKRWVCVLGGGERACLGSAKLFPFGNCFPLSHRWVLRELKPST